ncbi:uncharacterized protein LOC111397659 isoform X3 [Olea europaea var. sylvestris]|uniref:uncharacterized protein LOC111396724 isoform X3 n=1 Tax=Olea europaea var. sylvestris TaxID=158386 RepID=UPI000C1D5738|nr:uncharacterized protein LOC111396724 isoform X3 [Olea europaea var. sylvestris]XP_022880433.1 uncharacterized protein LOC111397659 isoform X3 [Olea europaea var. sylvestris]
MRERRDQSNQSSGTGWILATNKIKENSNDPFLSRFRHLLVDILTKEIIGRGTKRGGLYHMEDFSIGRAHFTHLFTSNKEQQILLWRC